MHPDHPVRRLSDMNRRILIVLALTAVVIVAAVAIERWVNRASASASPPPSTAAPAAAVEGTDSDPLFAVRIRAESAVYRSGQPIQVRAWLTYAGPKAQEKLVGSGSGLVLFSWEQLDGRLRQEAVATADCVPDSIKRDEALVVPFAKTGAFQGDDPDAGFWQRYFVDPMFRLPAGRYRIHAVPSFTVGECGGLTHQMDASVEILVLP
jgi:hypothetical protein